MEKKVLNYVKKNNLEENGLISAVDLIKVAKHFNIAVIEVMRILRTR